MQSNSVQTTLRLHADAEQRTRASALLYGRTLAAELRAAIDVYQSVRVLWLLRHDHAIRARLAEDIDARERAAETTLEQLCTTLFGSVPSPEQLLSTPGAVIDT